MKIQDSIIVSGQEVVIDSTAAHVSSQDNVYDGVVVVTAPNCKSRDDIVVGMGATDICL